ncbi:MAG: hypothetical protein HYZ72_10355 [Deltaproteobacteria bacterium]|nr:hypothetical protein [Deltaproteobacteria bacterium]
MSKHVVIIPGDDAAPEAMAPTVAILKHLALDLTFTEFPRGEEGVKRYGSRAGFEQALREAIDRSDTTGTTTPPCGSTAPSPACMPKGASLPRTREARHRPLPSVRQCRAICRTPVARERREKLSLGFSAGLGNDQHVLIVHADQTTIRGGVLGAFAGASLAPLLDLFF